MNIEIDPKLLLRNILLLIGVLLLANLSGIFIKYFLGYDYIFGIIPLFNFDTEMNIPTLYSSVALLVSSFFLAVIAITHKKNGEAFIAWFGLAAIFIFLAIDEISSIHEHLIEPVRASLNTSGLLYYAWVIPYGCALLAFLALYFKFILNLNKDIRILFITSGSIYVIGAIGFELIGGLQADLHGSANLTYALITTTEELLEMLGIALFIYSLNKYISQNLNGITFSIPKDSSST